MGKVIIVAVLIIIAGFSVLKDPWFLEILRIPGEKKDIEVAAPPVAAVTYKEVADSVKNAVFNCASASVIPDKTKKYTCQNLYTTDNTSLKSKVKADGSNRVFLYGQYVQFDCPAVVSSAKDPVGECYLAARFLDNWQIEKEMEIFGRKAPEKTVAYYLTETLEETKKLCSMDNIGGCVRDYKVYSPAYWDNGSLFFNSASGTFYERNKTTDSEKITYSAKITIPDGCYVVDNHEIQHIFLYEANPNLPKWFEEGFINLIGQTMYKNLCFPGMIVRDVKKQVGDKWVNIPDPFDLDDLNLEEPLASKLVQISEDRQCRKEIFMQIAKNLKNDGNLYLQELFVTISKGNGFLKGCL